MNSYSNSAPVDIDSVLDSKAATSEGPSFVVDTVAAQRRIDERAKTNRRTVHAGVRAPVDASPRSVAATLKEGIGRWLRWREQQGWSLDSGVQVAPPRPATDPTGNLRLVGMVEYPLQAVFRYTGRTPERVRFELPKDGVKQGPDHKLNLREAMRVWEVEPPADSQETER